METSITEIVLFLRAMIVIFLYAFLMWALLSMWRSLGDSKVSSDQKRPEKILFLIDQEGTSHHFSISSMTIGRHSDSDLILEDEAVSMRHAQLNWRKKNWWIRDLASRNGTFLNSILLEEEIALASNDEIIIGHTRFIVEFNQ